MAFYHAPDGKTYASRKRYADHLRREQRRLEKATFSKVKATVPAYLKAAPGACYAVNKDLPVWHSDPETTSEKHDRAKARTGKVSFREM